jgi:hypothetical protein
MCGSKSIIKIADGWTGGVLLSNVTNAPDLALPSSVENEQDPDGVRALHGWVFQPWLCRNGWKMQSIFVNGLRAPDAKTSAVKKCVRWMRTKSCHNADPHKPDCYMSAPPMSEGLIQEALDELEYLPCHYVHHLADAMRIIALFHPETDSRFWAWRLHYLIAEEIFHFVPETDAEFRYRHRDKAQSANAVKSQPVENGEESAKQ